MTLAMLAVGACGWAGRLVGAAVGQRVGGAATSALGSGSV